MAHKRSACAVMGIALSASLLPDAGAQTSPPAAQAAPPAATGRGDRDRAARAASTAANPADVGGAIQRTGGSLYRATLTLQDDPTRPKLAQVSLFAVPAPTPKTVRKHDLITVIIHEDSAFDSKGETDFNKSAEFDAKLDQFIKLNLKNLSIVGLPAAKNPADIAINSQRIDKNTGEVDRTDTLTARITAEVLDVRPNGTLVLQASKLIKTDEEEQQFILTGSCRVEDLSADNTVLSTQIFNLELQKNHKGNLRNATERGWLPKLLDFINPF